MTTAMTVVDRNKFMSAMTRKIAAVLPKHMTAERMAQVILVEFVRTPKLAECTQESLIASIMLASELGLEPGSQGGYLYLIPRKNKGRMECSPMLGYKGLAALAIRSGVVVNAGVVYQRELDEGGFVASHEPPSIGHTFTTMKPEDKADKHLVFAYATAKLPNGGAAQVILDRADIAKRQSRSASGSHGPWGTDFAPMARKSAIRALLTGGLVPLSAETPLARGLAAEIAGEPAIEPVPMFGPIPDAETVEFETVQDNGFKALQQRVFNVHEGDTERADDTITNAWAVCHANNDLPEYARGGSAKLSPEQIAALDVQVDVELGSK